MTLLTPEQFAAAQKANLETLFGLTTKAFEGVEKLVELNLQVVKSTLAESQENAQRALSVKDAQELLALQASLTQPVPKRFCRTAAICMKSHRLRRLNSPASRKRNTKSRIARCRHSFENVAKNAPAGSETAVAVIKSAITRREHDVRNGSQGNEASCRSR